MDSLFHILTVLDDLYWGYVGFILVLISGLFFTIKSKGYQFSILKRTKSMLRDVHHSSKGQDKGVHPFKLFFASVGGMVGLGNIVAVMTALTIGGPGALVWLWIASFFGMLIKYCEIYLGVKYRVVNNKGGYDGGPMYFLQKAFSSKLIPLIVATLLCIYGVEVLQFTIIKDTLVKGFGWEDHFVIAALLALTMFTAFGGVKRLAAFCSILMPFFMIGYILMCLYVVFMNADQIIPVLKTVFESAFMGHAPLGGFAGSTIILAAQQGISRAVYSGDIGIGYDSTVQAETKSNDPSKQAKMAIFALFTDTVICTFSMLVVLLTGLWTKVMKPSDYVATALAQYFPFIDVFMTVLFFLAGFTTIIAFFVVGMKSARFISKEWGEKVYMLYAIFAFIFFSFYDQTEVALIMTLSGGLLMLFNLWGIIKLRRDITFDK